MVNANSFFMVSEIGDYISKHGDAVKDVAFEVEDLDAIYKVSLLTYIQLHMKIRKVDVRARFI